MLFRSKPSRSVLKIYGNPNEINVSNIDTQSYPINMEYGQIFSNLNVNQELEWIFNKLNHSIKVKFTNGYVVNSISLAGNKSPYFTSRNIYLGSFYSTVIQRYGMPKSSLQDENNIVINYENISFKLNKSNSKPMQSWIVSEIIIFSSN